MPYEPHIRSAFDNDLDAVKAQVGKMGGLVEKALLNAAEALEAGDLALAAQVRADDRMIDDLEDMIQSECARIIARISSGSKRSNSPLQMIATMPGAGSSCGKRTSASELSSPRSWARRRIAR